MSDERETRIGTTRLRLVTGDIALRAVVGFLRRVAHPSGTASNG